MAQRLEKTTAPSTHHADRLSTEATGIMSKMTLHQFKEATEKGRASSVAEGNPHGFHAGSHDSGSAHLPKVTLDGQHGPADRHGKGAAGDRLEGQAKTAADKASHQPDGTKAGSDARSNQSSPDKTKQSAPGSKDSTGEERSFTIRNKQKDGTTTDTTFKVRFPGGGSAEHSAPSAPDHQQVKPSQAPDAPTIKHEAPQPQGLPKRPFDR